MFLTLTYPGAARWNQLDREKCKRDLDAFLKRMRRAYPEGYGTWKMEPQRRGAPHFHLLVFGAPFLPIGRLSRMWWDVVGSREQANLANGVDIRRARSWRGVARYVSKYVAKPIDALPEGWNSPGRWWGTFNRDKFKRELRCVPVSGFAAIRLRRFGARLVFGRNRERRLGYLSQSGIGLSVFASESMVERTIARVNELLDLRQFRGIHSSGYYRHRLEKIGAARLKRLMAVNTL